MKFNKMRRHARTYGAYSVVALLYIYNVIGTQAAGKIFEGITYLFSSCMH